VTAESCPACGAPHRVLGLLVIREFQYDRLDALLRGSLRRDVCAGCGHALETVSTIIVPFTPDGLVLYVAGTRMADPDGLTAGHLRAYLAVGSVPRIVRCADQATLCSAVRRRLAETLAPMPALLGAVAEGQASEYVRDHWRDLTPAVITAARLAIIRPGGHLRLPVQDPAAAPVTLGELLAAEAQPQAASTALNRLQVGVWQALAAAWDDPASAVDSGVTLPEDLDRYVVGEAVPANARHAIAEVFPDQVRGVYSLAYVPEAVDAAVALAFGRTNPRAQEWANLYFAHEAALRTRLDGPGPELRALHVPDQFAAATIGYEQAWQSVAETLDLLQRPEAGGRSLIEAARIVQSIAEQAGHPSLVAAVAETRMTFALPPDASSDEILDAIQPAGADIGIETVLARATVVLRDLSQARRASMLQEVPPRILAAHPGREADVIAWWAGRLQRYGWLRESAQALDAWPASADESVSPAVRARLWGARAALLAAQGRTEEAVALSRRALDLLDGDEHRDQRRAAQVNLAALLEAGYPDEALRTLEDVAYGTDRYGVDPELLARMAFLRVRTGDHELALRLLAEAQRMAGPSPAAAGYALQRCELLVSLDRIAEAVDILTAMDASAPTDVDSLLAASSAWGLLAARDAIPPAETERVARLPRLLAESAEAALAAGNIANHLRLLAGWAKYAELTGDPAAARLWVELVRRRDRYGVAALPEELVHAAVARYEADDRPEMRRLLGRVPEALARRYGAVPDITLLVQEPMALRPPLARLAGGLLAEPEPVWPEVRLVGELQRDSIGRARMAYRDARRSGTPAVPWLGEIDERLAQAGPLVLVEWVTTESSPQCVMTRIDGGTSSSVIVSLAPVRPGPVGRDVIESLQAGESRDPAEISDWRRLSGSLIDALAAHARSGDHVVFLHHDEYANLPWHIAIRDRWSTSYASGWAHLLEFLSRPPAPHERLGVCLVPTAKESADTVGRLSAARDRIVAAAKGPARTGVPEGSDRAFLTDLMADSDVVVMLCHGYRPEDGQEVAFALAHAGHLPSADSVELAKTPAHLFGWRAVQRLPRAPGAVLSAACSTGYSYGAGLGDRLGLGGALRAAGTASLLAPVHDIDAIVALPLIEAIADRFLAGESLAEAVRQAAREFVTTGPDWPAWSLALEGDYR
jgi:tetratricopeptide (TPR) repeat protein